MNVFAGTTIKWKMENVFQILPFKIALLVQLQIYKDNVSLFVLGITIILINLINVLDAQIILYGILLKENALVLVDLINFKGNVFLLANHLQLEWEPNALLNVHQIQHIKNNGINAFAKIH